MKTLYRDNKGLHRWLFACGAVLVLFYLFRGNRAAVNFWVYSVTLPFEQFLGRACAALPFSVAELLYVLAAVTAVTAGGLLVLVGGYLLKSRPKRRAPARPALPTPAGVERVDVLSATEMYDAAVRAFEGSDGAVMCAAVADYTPDRVSDTKIKKCDGDMCITLRRTRDIAAELGAHKGGRLLVGFALETHDEQAHAEAKLEKKNFDFIVLNSLRDAGAGFRGDTNKVTFIDRTGREELPLLSKREVAERIAERIEEFFAE